ncbi:MAG: hypothetical protein P4L68_08085 [Methylovirgula sp.]|nr:hypothetical protein [Methylovirgula sp.]
MTLIVKVERSKRGDLVASLLNEDFSRRGQLECFDHISEVVPWFIGAFPEPGRQTSAPALPDATDLREGVSFTQHAALDLLDQRRALWSQISINTQISMAHQDAIEAERLESCAFKVSKLIEAAARLLDAAERLTAYAEARDNG